MKDEKKYFFLSLIFYGKMFNKMLNIGKERILVAPTEVRCEFLKPSFFVVAVFV